MFRNNTFFRNNIRYNETFRKAQDYELWTRIIDTVNMNIIPRKLLKYRKHPSQASAIGASEQLKNTQIIRERYLSRLGTFNSEEIRLFHAISELNEPIDISTLRNCTTFLNSLYLANLEKKAFQNDSFNRLINKQLLRISCASSHIGIKEWKHCRDHIAFYDRLDRSTKYLLDCIFAGRLKF